jgi:hypothetical protein
MREAENAESLESLPLGGSDAATIKAPPDNARPLPALVQDLHSASDQLRKIQQNERNQNQRAQSQRANRAPYP